MYNDIVIDKVYVHQAMDTLPGPEVTIGDRFSGLTDEEVALLAELMSKLDRSQP